MIDVAGGTYFEKCEFPYWNQFYGSGGRAAVALSRLSRKVTLHTYVGRDGVENLDVLASSFNISVEAAEVRSSVRFQYFHGLSRPVVTRPTDATHPIVVSGKVVLRYGFVEGDAVVKGDRVVYDPQSVSDPKHFHQNGSEANELAVVANRAEAERLSGERDPRKIIRKIVKVGRADVVVVKDGPRGALVFSKGVLERVPAFKTGAVFPIGSGDVFAAAFAHFWGVQRLSADRSATLASIATARYCDTRALPLPATRGSWTAKHLEPIKPRLTRKKRLVYLAGPFFSLAQRWIIDEARVQLSSRAISVFSPFHEVGRGDAAHVVPVDLRALKRADVVYAIADGLDSGTLFEVGYARAMGKPVVVFTERETSDELKMLEGSQCVIERDFTSSIYKTIWKCLER